MRGLSKLKVVALHQNLKGLVLAGGKSLRMGQSKAKMRWYGKEQQYYLADLLGFFCEEVFISCREDQAQELDQTYQLITDKFASAGPLEAILSAFQKYADSAWLVVACDLPLLDKNTLDLLIEERDETAIATVFENPEDNLPEPLIAIWEAKSFEILKLCQQKQHRSLRETLIQNNAKTIKAPNQGALINVNTKEDVRLVLTKLNLPNVPILPYKRSI